MNHTLKEDLRQICGQSSKAHAARFPADGCGRVLASGIKVLITIANALEGHRTGILNWYEYRISTSPLEGVNNNTVALQRMACGDKDKDYRWLQNRDWLPTEAVFARKL
ncbi:MAG: transposase [Planctomyces sp.]